MIIFTDTLNLSSRFKQYLVLVPVRLCYKAKQYTYGAYLTRYTSTIFIQCSSANNFVNPIIQEIKQDLSIFQQHNYRAMINTSNTWGFQ